MSIKVRPAKRSDERLVTDLLAATFPSRPAEKWALLFNYPWFSAPPDYGFLAEERGRVIGFMGAIYSDRRLGGEVMRVCGMSSWCVSEDQRGRGVGKMVADAYLDYMAAQGLPVMLLSVGPHVVDFFVERGSKSFLEFRRVRYAVPSFFDLLSSRRAIWVEASSLTRNEVGERAYRIVQDHLELHCHVRSIRIDGHTLVIISRRRVVGIDRPRWATRMAGEQKQSSTGLGRWIERGKDILRGSVPSTEVLFVSDAKLFRKHLRTIVPHLTFSDRTVAISGPGEVLGLPSPSGCARVDDYMYIGLPESIDPSELDALYSELVLLGL